MNEYIKIGTSIVILALILYSIGVFSEQRKKTVNKISLLFISLGIIADITATSFMIIGSSKGMISLHGFIGYSSLTAMLIDAILLWRVRIKNGCGSDVPKTLHLYTRIAYIWWVAAFITGGLLVALR